MIARLLQETGLGRIDRYIFRQILGPFLFFVLVFTGVIWLTQSLRVIDTVVNNGQSATVFLEFTALLLPMVLSIVLPVSVFAAVLFAINRLFTDSEIVVMLASGLSGTSLLKAVAVFSALVMIVVFALTLYLMPTAQREMRDRITQIRGDVAVAFVREGQFLTPMRNVSVYLRETGRAGEMFGVLVHDERDPDRMVTYTAERALLVRDDQGTRLVMFDGVAQSADVPSTTSLSILRFDRLSYDLSPFAEPGPARARKPSEMYLPDLLEIDATQAAPRSLGDFRAEAHEALSAPLYVLALPLLAVAFVISSGFRRQGFTGRIVLAAIAGLALRLSGLAAKSLVTGAAVFWPLMYVPPLLGVIAAFWMLTDWRRRAVQTAGAA
ncbi:MAG: LPS export ABC transporter permease LptF [Pseudomonadota bacterium]